MVLDLKRLKAERIASGLTQEEVALKMGWADRAPYAKRENGIVPIGADELAKLGALFGYNRDQIGIFFKNDVPDKEQSDKMATFEE